MEEVTVGAAAARTGWSPRMLRYLEEHGLVRPRRTASGYRLYGLGQLNQLRALRELRSRFAVELEQVAFAARLRREPELRRAGGGRLIDRPFGASRPREKAAAAGGSRARQKRSPTQRDTLMIHGLRSRP